MTSTERYAFCMNELRRARKEKLKELGETEESLRAMAEEVANGMDSTGVAKTEYGTLQIVPNLPVQWSARKSADDTRDMIHRTKLIFISAEK